MVPVRHPVPYAGITGCHGKYCSLMECSRYPVSLGVFSSHQAVLSARQHAAHPVSVVILHPREMRALWSQHYDTHASSTLSCSRVCGEYFQNITHAGQIDDDPDHLVTHLP